MNDLFTGVPAFVVAAEAGSFTAAAERLGLSPAAVSKAVRRLEEALGVRLFDRTTRRVRLSDEGARFHARCRAAVDAVQAGRDAIALARDDPRGEVTISLSPALAPPVVARLDALLARHPGLAIHLRVSDRLARLVDEGVDVAVRTGALQDSALVARPLGRTRWVTAAAPAWLARRGTPKTPGDLAEHACITFVAPDGQPVEWRFRGAHGPFTWRPPARLDIDAGPLVVAAAEAGLGVCQAFDLMVAPAVRAGRLVVVLADQQCDGPPISALCLPGRQRLPRIRAVLDFLAETFAPAT